MSSIFQIDQMERMESRMESRMEPGMIIKHRISWSELQKYIKNPPIVSFPKGIIVYNKYQDHINKIGDIYQYLMKYLFDDNSFYKIKNADFPYYVSEYVTHKIIWFNPNYYQNIKFDYDFVFKILKQKYKKFVVFENIFRNKSVKNICHFHFFILNVNFYDIIV